MSFHATILERLNALRNENNTRINDTIKRLGLTPLQVGFQTINGGLRAEFVQAVFLDRVILYVEDESEEHFDEASYRATMLVAMGAMAREHPGSDTSTVVSYISTIEYITLTMHKDK